MDQLSRTRCSPGCAAVRPRPSPEPLASRAGVSGNVRVGRTTRATGRGERLADDVAGVGHVAAPRHGAVVEHDHPVAQAERVAHLLLDDEQRRSRVAEAGEALVELVDDDRRQPERQLVGDEDLRHLDQHPGQRQHALLAARQRAGRLAAALAEPREQLVGPLEAGLAPRRARDAGGTTGSGSPRR